jgi:hypothetical protein
MLPHWIGILGETLNFFGALVLALDLLLRRREDELDDLLQRATIFAQKHGLRTALYRNLVVASSTFSKDLLHRRKLLLGLLGTGMLAAGFLCLACYHAMEIRKESSSPQTPCHGVLTRKFRISDTDALEGDLLWQQQQKFGRA